MYSRYIPPPKPKQLEPPKDPPSTDNPTPSANLHPTKSRPRSPKPQKRKRADVQAEDDDARHKTVLEKRDRSLRKAEKLARKSPKDGPKHEIPEEPILESTSELHDLIPLPQPEPVPEASIPSISSLPSWLASPIRISHNASAKFTDVGLDHDIANALSLKGFEDAFAVQAAVLPLLLPGHSQQPGDILVSAATGSGKTLAYVLPLVENLSKHKTTKLRGVIVTPTRDLVAQARDVAEKCAAVFSSGPNRKHLRIGTAIGSENFRNEQSSLFEEELVYDPEEYAAQTKRLNAPWKDNSDADYDYLIDDETVSGLPDHVLKSSWKIDVLVCTPGRLVEHLKSAVGFDLQSLKWLVVDEADKLLDQSFQQWLEAMNREMPENLGPEARQDPVRKVILSATMTKDIGKLSEFKLYRPKLVVLEGSSSLEAAAEGSHGHVLPKFLTESAIKVEDDYIKPLYVLEILKRQSILLPADGQMSEKVATLSDSTSEGQYPTSHGALIFTKSNEDALRLSRLFSLIEPRTHVATLTSTTRHSARRTSLKSFQSGQISILVASDLISRGLDLTNLEHVINYDMPTSVTSYVHRVGRTARAGKSGHAWTLFTNNEAAWFWNKIGRSSAIERPAGSKISRVNIKASQFDLKRMEAYETALNTLEKETKSSK